MLILPQLKIYTIFCCIFSTAVATLQLTLDRGSARSESACRRGGDRFESRLHTMSGAHHK